MPSSPNMGLSILVPGVSTGPGWATSLESDKLLLDAHTHVSGQGLQVPTAGLNINAALPFANNAATGVAYVGLQSQVSLQSGVLLSSLQQQSGDLYWNSVTGVPVKLTSGNAINVSSFGGITGLAGTTAALTYSAALELFIATSETGESAGWDGGTVTIRPMEVASAAGVTLTAPTTIKAGGYTTTLPSSGLSFSTTPGQEFLLNTFGTNYTPAHFVTIGDGVNTFGDWNGSNEVPFQQANQWATVTPTAASGAMVFVKRGSYIFQNPLLVTATGLQFVGESKNGTVITGQPAALTDTALVTLSGSFQGWSNMTIQPFATAPVRTHGLMTAVTATGCNVRDNIINVQNAGFSLGAAIEMHGCGNSITGNTLTAANQGSRPALGTFPRGAIDTFWQPGPNNSLFICSGNMIANNRIVLPTVNANLVFALNALAVSMTSSGAQAASWNYVSNVFTGNVVDGSNRDAAPSCEMALFGAGLRSNVAGQLIKVTKNVITNNTFWGQMIPANTWLYTLGGSNAGAVREIAFGNLITANVCPSGTQQGSLQGLTQPAASYGLNSSSAGLGKFFVAATSGGAVTHQINDLDQNADM